jgi:ABC-type lipoprotein release transport system permease subunit
MPENWPIGPRFLVPLLVGALLLAVLLVGGKVPLRYNVRNLLVRWRVAALTALAFTLVVSLLMVMLSFMNGMSRLSEGGHPGNVIVLSNGLNDEVNSNLPRDVAEEVSTLANIVRDAEGHSLCSQEVYVGVSQPLDGERGWRRRLMEFRGIEDPAITVRVRDVELLPGGAWFSPAGVCDVHDKDGKTISAIQAVLGEGAAREWGLSLGDLFDGGTRKWVVVGIMKSTGSARDSEVWATRRGVGQTFGKEEAYTTLVLRTPDADSARQLSDYLSHDYPKVALNAQPEKEYYSKLAETNQGLLYAAYFLAFVISVGGVFGVMNTMFAAISQRAKDIGTLRILGFSRWQVLVSFFIESMVLALAGGLTGCALGLLANGRRASSILAGKSVAFTMIVDGDTLAIGLLFTLGMGAIGGLLPALSAMRVKPLESLR